MTPSLILIQGPPGSGKDAVGKILTDANFHVVVDKFARHLKEQTHALFGLYMEDDEGPREHWWYDSAKDEPSAEFNGMTPREAYIWLSQEVMKPKFGQDYYGCLLLHDIANTTALNRWHGLPKLICAITDSGFAAEARPLIEFFGADKTVILQLARPGKSFMGDSRCYWSDANVTLHTVNNNGTLADLEDALKHLFPDLFPKKENDSHESSACYGPRPSSSR